MMSVGVKLTADRLLLANAVVRPGERARYVLEDNSLGDFVAIEVATASGLAYAVPVRPDILVGDVDDDTALARAAINKTVTLLHQSGIAAVICESGGKGRLHVFARVPDSELLARCKSLLRSMKVDVRQGGSIIRPPLAPHRSAGTPGSRLLQPPDVLDAVEALRPLRRRELPPRITTLLLSGVSNHNSDSERYWTIMLSMVQRDFTFLDAWELLSRHPGGGSLRKEGRRSHAWALRDWWKAIAWVKTHPSIQASPDAVVEMLALRALVDGAPWRGRTGVTDAAVLGTLLDVAIASGSVVVSHSWYQLTEKIGRCQPRTVGDSLERLRLAGWISIDTPGSGRMSTSYRLHRPASLTNTPLITSLPMGGVRSSGVLMRHDAFGYAGGLGARPAQMRSALEQASTSHTAAELAAMTGIPRSTVHHALIVLEKRGLAIRVSNGWVAGQTSPDDVAVRRGSAGAGAELRERNRRRRLDYNGGEQTEDGRLLMTVTAAAENRPCTAMTRSGAPCRSHAMHSLDRCVAHRRTDDFVINDLLASETEDQLVADWENEAYA